MAKLIVTADVHGSFGAWMTIKKLLGPYDHLAVAGDLFDTRYGDLKDPDFQPGEIKKDLSELKNPFYYVYGNCDVKSFYPDQKNSLNFDCMGTKILLHHGHNFTTKIPADIQLVIQGHTHIASLKTKDNIIFLNPGSLAVPRNNIYTYGVIENKKVKLINIKTGETLISLTAMTKQ
ncbi:MAG: YfcE family phosphodiesterase [Thermodesulfobacteriota bacterium]|nr:YfcE family phosphodiesterase [Thermodesulfobacteriota bacterium]